MREFGFGANRVLRPYQNNGDDEGVPTYQDPNVKPFFRLQPPSKAERNSLGYNEYARQQDNLATQERLINQKLADQQAQRQQAQRKVARLEQVQDVEDQANEALASGMPVEQVIRAHPGLAQSPSFSNYMAQAKAVTPAQQTLAPHYRKMLKTPEERADFDQAFQHFGNVTQADDHARARAQERAHRVALVDAGVPLEHIENAAKNGPLTAERAALLKQQFKKSVTGGDPRAEKVFETASKMVSEGGTKEAVQEYLDRMKSLGVDITPPAKVEPVVAAAPVVDVVQPATAEEAYPIHEQVRQAKVAAQINAPGNDENFYSKIIADPSIPLPQKKAALEKFEEYAQNPPKKAGSTIGEALARKETLNKALAQAKEDVEFHPVREQFSNDWQKSKNEMGDYVRRFADSLGVDEKEAIASLKEDEELKISAPGEQPRYRRVRPLFEEFIAKKLGIEKLRPFLRSADERLSEYSNHKFAPRLGVHPFSLPGFPNAGRTLAIGQQPVSNEDVLNAYVAEHTKKAPNAAPVVQSTAPEKIVIGTPKKKP